MSLNMYKISLKLSSDKKPDCEKCRLSSLGVLAIYKTYGGYKISEKNIDLGYTIIYITKEKTRPEKINVKDGHQQLSKYNCCHDVYISGENINIENIEKHLRKIVLSNGFIINTLEITKQ